MKLFHPLMYAGNPREAADQVVALERAGLDGVWVAEAYGPDAVSILAFIAAQTKRIALGAGVLQIPGRTPAATANAPPKT